MNYKTQYCEYMANVFPIIFVLVVLLMFSVYFIYIFHPFLVKHRYIKMELNRTEGSEHRFWKKELKRNYIRLIPFVGQSVLRYRR